MTLLFSAKPLPGNRNLLIKKAESAPVINRKETAEIIPWAFDRRLSWEDFLGEPQKNTDAVATTSTTLGLAYKLEDGQLVYSITCDFSKVKSWGSMKTDYILSHEQGHFDITEIHARKLYEALQQYEFNRKSYKHDINVIYQQIVRSKEDMQAVYDAESDHSRRRAKQFDWEERITQLLQDTEPFASYP
jgi:predicted secreted Zn-dependent protease